MPEGLDTSVVGKEMGQEQDTNIDEQKQGKESEEEDNPYD